MIDFDIFHKILADQFIVKGFSQFWSVIKLIYCYGL